MVGYRRMSSILPMKPNKVDIWSLVACGAMLDICTILVLDFMVVGGCGASAPLLGWMEREGSGGGVSGVAEIGGGTTTTRPRPAGQCYMIIVLSPSCPNISYFLGQ